jgi:hypothetical protein
MVNERWAGRYHIIARGLLFVITPLAAVSNARMCCALSAVACFDPKWPTLRYKEALMAKYYFHFKNGDTVDPDDDGIELPDISAAA